METNHILIEILKQFQDKGYSQVEGYNSFGYVKETPNAVHVSRENGKDTPIPLAKLILGIEAYKSDFELYEKGPSSLRGFGITHVTSPIWSLLHLVDKTMYRD
jgi:hypothetical protein